jgi:hypothetical protein
MTFIVHIGNWTLNFVWKHKIFGIAKAILSKKSSRNPTSKYTKRHRIRTSWYCHKNKYEDQWNRTKNPDINPQSYAHQTFD